MSSQPTGMVWNGSNVVRQAVGLSPATPNAPNKVSRAYHVECALQGKHAGGVALHARTYTATQHRMYKSSQVLRGVHYINTDVCATASMNTSVLLSRALPGPAATCKGRTSYTVLSLDHSTRHWHWGILRKLLSLAWLPAAHQLVVL